MRPTSKIDPERIKLCNCAGCERELLGRESAKAAEYWTAHIQMTLPPPVSARINGRPYCSICTHRLTRGNVEADVVLYD